jgi:AcrR family transcriptional regulator
MSDKRKHSPPIDARSRKSRDALGDALVALMQEKQFEDITVQNVLDRAGVSRSTFYHHFKDKDDLFDSDAGEFFEQVGNRLTLQGDPTDRVFPIREFFQHVSAMKTFIANLAASGKLHENMAQGRIHFARGIERRLSGLGRARGLDPATRPVIAMAYAGVVVSLLLWWLDQGMVQDPAELDELFHRLVWTGLETRTPARAQAPWV